MTDPTYTHIELIVDESGSMMAHRDDTEGGVNAYLAEQRSVPGRATVTLTTFSDRSRVLADRLPVADVPAFTLRPRGSTALYDAVGATIDRCGEWLAGLPEDERPGLVSVEIVTDGRENASTDVTAEQLRTLIDRQQTEYAWVFSYMGANQDAILVGAALGVPAGRSLTYSTASTLTAFGAKSRQTARLRHATITHHTVADVTYSGEDRENAVAGG